MDTVTLDRLLTKALGSDIFKGVHPASNLPLVGNNTGKEIHYPFAFIENTDTADKPGAHWVAFYFDINGKGHYFDSFGKMPMYRDWQNYIQGNSKLGEWDYNIANIQPLDSTACGHFCVTYLVKRHLTGLHIGDHSLMCDVTESDVIDFTLKLCRTLGMPLRRWLVIDE